MSLKCLCLRGNIFYFSTSTLKENKMTHVSATTLLVVLFCLLTAPIVISEKSTVNNKVKIKRDAKAKAKKTFLSKHGMVFDSYGRVLRWGKEPNKYECKKNKKVSSGIFCTVTESTSRKYRTKEEDRRGKMIILDKQAEVDSQFGSGSDDAKRARRRRKENRQRCSLYNEWLINFEKDESEQHKQFYQWLTNQFEDFATLRRLQPGRKGVRKAKKLYRNIAR